MLSRDSKTRELVEKSGRFALQVPTVRQARLTYAVGSSSLSDDLDKLKHCGVELFRMEGHDIPFVVGCSAWLACRLIPEPHNQDTYDLFIGEVVGAWADSRVFREGRWHFENADPSWRSLHHIAGGQFYTTGDPVRGTD